ncbi:DNA-directed DNA polymerase alpha subunit pol12 [Linnemannia elongata]|nr:DNA-directed DNA polymerase alpha subunit pol12 [Linnemannia elongata]
MNQELELIDVFGNTLATNPSALAECVGLLRIYRIEPGTLHSKWEAYIMNAISSSRDEDDGSMTPTHLEGFKNHLRHTLEKKAQQNIQRQVQSASGSSFATTKKAQLKSRFPGSSSQAPRVFHDMEVDQNDQLPTPSSKQFALRKNMSETEEILHSHLKLRTEPPRAGSEYKSTVTMITTIKPYRYMFEKITDKGEALDDRIDAFAELYRRSYPDTEFRNPAYPSQAVVTVVGRICSDANEGKANEQSLLLETSRSFGSGKRVKLDIMEVPGYSFFPGQIVVLSGLNSYGSVFAVTRVHEMPAMDMAGASPADLEDFQYKKMAGQPMKMIVAAGPYTLSDNLLFEPFAALMEHVNTERPDILLLMGPFVSSSHPLVVSGDIDMMPEAYFAKYISALLAKHQDRYPKEMQILLVPSLQDVIHETLVLPQPGFEHPRALGLPTGTYCLPNPAQFTINEMVFAVNTADILMHLSGDEIARKPDRTDRMSRLSKYIIEQRKYVSEEDASAPFFVTVDNVIVINPNQLSKMQSGGTFAKLTIHPIPEGVLSDEVMMMDEDDERTMRGFHRVQERCRVDLVRV